MKVTRIDTFVVGPEHWHPWLFCAVRTDDGITGYAEFGEGGMARPLVALVEALAPMVIGRDPGPIERIRADMFAANRYTAGGLQSMAIAGIELALWDVKGKALGTPVHRLVGGPFRERQQVYWSHMATFRASSPGLYGTPPLRTWDDVANAAQEVVAAGYTAFKTNIMWPGKPSRLIDQQFAGPHDLNAPTELLEHVVKQVSVLRDAVGPDVDIALDINANFRTEGAIRIARALEQFDLMWLEIDLRDPAALSQIKSSTRTPICSGEQMLGVRDYRPFFALHAVDIVKVDVQWQGFSSAKLAADLAEVYELNIAPHNLGSHLSTFQGLNLSAAVSNVRIMESDVDAPPWRDELTTVLPDIKDGYMAIPQQPGWGCDLDEAALKKYAYTG